MAPASPSPRRILVVFNPAAGGDRRARFNRIMGALRAYGCVVTVIETTGRRHAEAIARDVPERDFDVIAAAGGDGTVNEIVNGLGAKDIALGLMPLGTANVLADEIGLRPVADEVAKTLAFGPIRPIRVGTVNGRRFTMMAGIGFDAEVVHRVSLPLKRWIGPLAYVWQSMKQAPTYRFTDYEVSIDGAIYPAAWVVVCKGRRYGGPFIVAPAAALADDEFYVLLMRGRGWTSVLRYGIALMLSRLTALQDVRLVRGREVIVNTAPGQLVQADGDIVATLPLRIAVDPTPVRLVYPGEGLRHRSLSDARFARHEIPASHLARNTGAFVYPHAGERAQLRGHVSKKILTILFGSNPDRFVTYDL